MEKEIKQILKNQLIIMGSQNNNWSEDIEFISMRREEIDSTKQLLNPKATDEPCCDMDDAKRGRGE